MPANTRRTAPTPKREFQPYPEEPQRRPKRFNSGQAYRSHRLASEDGSTTDDFSSEEDQYLHFGGTVTPAPVSSGGGGGGGGSKSSSKPRKWEDYEDELLTKAVEHYGEANWKAIASKVGSRNHVQCLQRWKKVLAPGLVKGQWGAEEDEALMRLATKPFKNWGTLSTHMKGRTSKQCRERWCHHLNPEINKGEYDSEEDATILETQAKLGNRWSRIAARLPGRTENSIKIRCKALKRRNGCGKSAAATAAAAGASSPRPSRKCAGTSTTAARKAGAGTPPATTSSCPPSPGPFSPPPAVVSPSSSCSSAVPPRSFPCAARGGGGGGMAVGIDLRVFDGGYEAAALPPQLYTGCPPRELKFEGLNLTGGSSEAPPPPPLSYPAVAAPWQGGVFQIATGNCIKTELAWPPAGEPRVGNLSPFGDAQPQQQQQQQQQQDYFSQQQRDERYPHRVPQVPHASHVGGDSGSGGGGGGGSSSGGGSNPAPIGGYFMPSQPPRPLLAPGFIPPKQESYDDDLEFNALAELDGTSTGFTNSDLQGQCQIDTSAAADAGVSAAAAADADAAGGGGGGAAAAAAAAAVGLECERRACDDFGSTGRFDPRGHGADGGGGEGDGPLRGCCSFLALDAHDDIVGDADPWQAAGQRSDVDEADVGGGDEALTMD